MHNYGANPTTIEQHNMRGGIMRTGKCHDEYLQCNK